jgi:hypothetical protein
MLQAAVGHVERCPGESCPFWNDEGCALAEIRPDIESNPELGRFLLDLRASGVEGWSPLRRAPRSPRRAATT